MNLKEYQINELKNNTTFNLEEWMVNIPVNNSQNPNMMGFGGSNMSINNLNNNLNILNSNMKNMIHNR